MQTDFNTEEINKMPQRKEETAEQKLKRLTTKTVNQIGRKCDSLRRLANLNPKPEQAKLVFDFIKSKLQAAEHAWATAKAEEKQEFALK